MLNADPWRQAAFNDINTERDRQIEKWGPQHHWGGTGSRSWIGLEQRARELNEEGNCSWLTILLEEVFEAASEEDVKRLEIELIQVAAVAVAWIEDINGRVP